MMRRKDVIGGVGTLLLVGLAVACSINPQPIPPEDTASAFDASTTSPGAGGTAGSGAESDASAAATIDGGLGLNPGPDAAGPEDGGEPIVDGGDGGELDASDAAPEEDGSSDAGDAD